MAVLGCCAFGGLVVGTARSTALVEAAPTDAPSVSLIGDSTMAAMGWYRYDNADVDTLANNDVREIVGNTYQLVYSAESCRRLVSPSCRGRFGDIPRSMLPLMKTTLAGRLGEALVVMAGYDDPSISTSVDLIMAEAERQGVERVLWLTYRTTTAYTLPGGLSARTLYERHNAELAGAAARHASMRILDWNAAAAGKASWFTGDGIHLTSAGAVGLAHFIADALAQQPLGRCRASAALTGQVLDGTGAPRDFSGARSGLTPIAPVRVLDTREPGLGGSQGKVGAGRTVVLDVGNAVPSGATDVVLTMTAVDACAGGFITAYGCGQRPGTSSINFEVGRTTAGMAIVALDGGTVCVFSSSATDLVIDVTGSFGSGGEPFHSIDPTRWIDTRGADVMVPTVTGVQRTGSEIEVPLRGVDGVPVFATAVWLNLTIADAAAATVLLAYPGPCGSPPLASTVNARAGQNAASSALIGIGPTGTICVRTLTGTAHVVLDVAGWFGTGSGGLLYQAQPPTRLLDTRVSLSAPTADEAAVAVETVAVLNIVSTESSASGFVAVRPCGTSKISSLINVSTAENTANVTAVGPGVGDATCVRANVPSHLVVDQTGAFVP